MKLINMTRCMAISAMICVFFIITSCSANQSSTSVNQSATPIETLSPFEKRIFDSLIVGIDDFYNPQTARILEIRRGEWSGDSSIPISDGNYDLMDSTNIVFLRITSDNQAGGSVTDYYSLGLLKKSDYEGSLDQELRNGISFEDYQAEIDDLYHGTISNMYRNDFSSESIQYGIMFRIEKTSWDGHIVFEDPTSDLNDVLNSDDIVLHLNQALEYYWESKGL